MEGSAKPMQCGACRFERSEEGVGVWCDVSPLLFSLCDLNATPHGWEADRGPETKGKLLQAEQALMATQRSAIGMEPQVQAAVF